MTSQTIEFQKGASAVRISILPPGQSESHDRCTGLWKGESTESIGGDARCA